VAILLIVDEQMATDNGTYQGDTMSVELHVPDRRGTDSIKWGAAADGEIPLWVADMDFAVAPAITAAMQERLQHPVFGYSTLPEECSAAFLRWVDRRHHWTLASEAVVPVPAVMPAIATAIQAFTRPGDQIAVLTPVYFPFFEVITDAARHVYSVPLIARNYRYAIDFSALDTALRQCTMLLLCSPHNPGGRVWTIDELTEISAIAQRHKVMVVSDEIHGDLTFPGQPFYPLLSVPGDDQFRIALHAPSKTFNIPGLPAAWGIIPREDQRRQFQNVLRTHRAGGLNVVTAAAMQGAYEHGDSWLDAVRSRIYENYRLLQDLWASMPGQRVYRMEGTYIPWIYTGLPSVELSRRGRAHGVWVQGGILFGAPGEGHVRINVATSPQLLRQGLERLQQACAEMATVDTGSNADNV
jgi:cystathionine beta-lyase